MYSSKKFAPVALTILSISLAGTALAKSLAGAAAQPQAKAVTLLNVSYDPTRELYQDINSAFIARWNDSAPRQLEIQQSHGGSGKQARAVIDGLEADVVTLALAYDIDAISRQTKFIPANWQSRLPNNSAPFSSTIVFLVRKGNPKGIMDWSDLAKQGVSVITPNPKTSGGARWNYLALWAYGLKAFSGDEQKTKALVAKVFANVPVLDAGARGSTTTFVERRIGDVLLAWENEALFARKKFGSDKFDIVVPPVSILAEPPVAVVERVAQRRGTLDAAQGYLHFLYTPQAQEIGAKHFYRPTDASVAVKYTQQFPRVTLITVDSVFGGWAKAQAKHFADGGTFDQIYKPGT